MTNPETNTADLLKKVLESRAKIAKVREKIDTMAGLAEKLKGTPLFEHMNSVVQAKYAENDKMQADNEAMYNEIQKIIVLQSRWEGPERGSA